MVDEEKYGCLLDMIIRVGRVARSCEAPFLIGHFEWDEFIRYSRTVDLADTVYGTSVFRRREAVRRVSKLLAGKGDAFAMDGVTTDNVQNFGIFFARRLEGFLS